jgi:hypothetical protein
MKLYVYNEEPAASTDRCLEPMAAQLKEAAPSIAVRVAMGNPARSDFIGRPLPQRG